MSLKSLSMFPHQQSADELDAPGAVDVASKYLYNAKKRLYIRLLLLFKYRLEDITKVHYMYLPDLFLTTQLIQFYQNIQMIQLSKYVQI